MNRSLLGAILVLFTPYCLAAEDFQEVFESYRLESNYGNQVVLGDLAEKQVVVFAFLGTECPLAKLYGPRLQTLSEQYKDQGVAILGICSNKQDSLTELTAYVHRFGIDFPMLKDVGNRLADAVGASRTPEVFVFDQARKLRYHGRIDDQYGVGYSRDKTTVPDLQNAIDDLLAGRDVSVAETKAIGCIIGRVKEVKPVGDITYTRDIAPILNTHCVECHREQEIGPFTLTSYEDTLGWEETILEVISDNRMPPWSANPAHGQFANDPRLSEREIETLKAWVVNGMPEGDPADLPEPPKFAEGWKIPKPDQVLTMAPEPFQVPAQGVVDYQRFVVDPGWEEDKYIYAAEARPENRSVVHHILVFVIPPNAERIELNQVLVGYAPGSLPIHLKDGLGMKIAAGSKLVFELHYTPNGVAQDDLSSVGFIFADPKTVKQEVATQEASNGRFRIPPHAGNHEVKSKYVFGRDTILLTLFPHMHLRGKSFRYTLDTPGKEPEILLDVPHFDFNWQNGYRLAEPRLVPAGSTLHCTAHFDNSEKNLSNPDPTEEVRWGDQTWEEMMIGYFDMCIADQDLTKVTEAKSRTKTFLSQLKKAEQQLAPLANGLRDGLVSQESLRRYGAELRKVVPQVYRIDWSYVDEGTLRIDRVAQASGPEMASRPLQLQARGLALSYFLSKEEVTVNSDLSKLRNSDMRLMRRFLGSSVHIPYKYSGRQGMISFWSEEPDAFPTKAVEFLTKVVQSDSK